MLLTASLLLLALAGAVHTAVDARRRFANPATGRMWAVVALLLPILGAGLYLLVRPAETCTERRLRRRRHLCLEVVAQRNTAPAA